MPPPATKHSTPRLSEVARHVIIPEGIVSTGWPAVEQRCTEWGVRFDDWQRGLGRVILGKRANLTYAATVGGITLSIPRQVAKTFLVSRLIFALCSLFPGLRVLWTAQHNRTVTNTFRDLSGFALHKRVAPHVKRIRTANGEQEIEFTNGSIIMFGAREYGFGRGFDKIDVIVFDEAQILTLKALENMVATTLQTQHPHGALLFYMGTPPRPFDPGEVFTERRTEALAAKGSAPDFSEPVAAGDAIYVECSADPKVGKPSGPKLDDQGQWEIASPSFRLGRISLVSMLRLRKNLKSDEAWRREGLGVWDEASQRLKVFRPWPEQPAAAPADGVVAFGVKFSLDGARVSLAAARCPASGPAWVESIETRPLTEGVGWLVDWLALRSELASVVMVDGKSGSADLKSRLRKAGYPPRRLPNLTTEDVIAAHAGLDEAIKSGSAIHAQPGLTRAAANSGRRRIGTQGGWGIEPLSDGIDVLPLEAAILALHGARTSKPRLTGRTGGQRTTSGRRAVLM